MDGEREYTGNLGCAEAVHDPEETTLGMPNESVNSLEESSMLAPEAAAVATFWHETR
jgi:hypothetical protein